MKSGIINISFGETSSQPQSLVDLKINLNKQKADEMKVKLEETGFDCDNSIFVKIPNNNNCDFDALVVEIDKWIMEDPPNNNSENMTHSKLRQAISDKLLTVHVKRDHSSLWIQFKIDESIMESANTMLETLVESLELKPILEKDNELEVSVSSGNNFNTILNLAKDENNSILTSILNNLAFKIKLNFDETVLPKIKEGLEMFGILEELPFIPHIQALDDFEIDLENQSSEKLPELIKKLLHKGDQKEFKAIANEILKDKVFNSLLECIGGQFEILTFQPEICSVQISIQGEGFSDFIKGIK